MADTAQTASQKTSNDPGGSDHILERLEALADQYRAEGRSPTGMVYFLANEEEAAQILLAMAATIKHTAESITNRIDKQQYKAIARDYRQAVTQGRALETFRNMTEDDQLSIYGLKLSAQRIITQ